MAENNESVHDDNQTAARRDVDQAFSEANRMVDLILTPESEMQQEDRTWVAEETYRNFANHINKGFLEYRKSVTETDDFALTDWCGRGSILRDVMGREYIDMLGGFGLYSPGIRHPKIIAAVKAQLDRSPQYSQEMLDPLRAHLAKVIAKLTPGDIQYGFFANSGTEGVEGAMKLAKLYTGRKGFISMLQGFHGKTLGALSLLGKSVYREPLLPLLEGVRHVPFGNARAVEQALASAKTVGADIAAVVAEPVQGEAGAIVPPDDFWPRLREICDAYDVLLIADEVQTGFGRTGKIFGVDHWDVTPDIMCFGKALGRWCRPHVGLFLIGQDLEVHGAESVYAYHHHGRQSLGMRGGPGPDFGVDRRRPGRTGRGKGRLHPEKPSDLAAEIPWIAERSTGAWPVDRHGIPDGQDRL